MAEIPFTLFQHEAAAAARGDLRLIVRAVTGKEESMFPPKPGGGIQSARLKSPIGQRGDVLVVLGYERPDGALDPVKAKLGEGPRLRRTDDARVVRVRELDDMAALAVGFRGKFDLTPFLKKWWTETYPDHPWETAWAWVGGVENE